MSAAHPVTLAKAHPHPAAPPGQGLERASMGRAVTGGSFEAR
ncbi:hypothetical protein F8B43_0357 [Methylorubrum populi]|uniref:Uncharacterized protein n=1 Tax=Methylorubrum populi TaxID=223967 RepID=A0A833JBU2_9HYPH|nr:hypothetical protein F8B43_0357 [Methylorubrum populi]